MHATVPLGRLTLPDRGPTLLGVRRILCLLVALSACDAAEPEPSPFEQQATASTGSETGVEQEPPDHDACLALAECLAGCGNELGCDNGYWYDEDCAEACERGASDLDGDVMSDAYKVAFSCDVCPDSDCADRSESCG